MDDFISIDFFLEMEKKYDMYSKEVLGINYWNYVRFNLWNYDICSAEFGLKSPHNTGLNSKIKVILSDLIELKNGLFHSGRTVRKKNILIYSHERRIKQDDLYYCPYTSVISKEYNDNSVTIETPAARKHFRPIPENNIIYTDLINIGSQVSLILKKKAHNDYAVLCDAITRDIEGFVGEIQKHYNWKTELDHIVRKCADMVIITVYEKKKFSKLLDRIRPRVIIEVVGYSNERMTLNELAKDRGIPVIELQHGTVYENHAAYQYGVDSGIKQFPDYIFTFSEFWNNRMRVPIPNDHLISVGYPHFEDEIARYSKDARRDPRITILFISQGTIGQELAALAVKLSQMLSEEQYRLIFKLHPSEVAVWKERYNGLSDTNIEVKGKDGHSLYELFAISDIQIGVYSTAVYEGLGFGLKTYIYKIGHYMDMRSLVDEGWAEYISDENEAYRCICECDSNKSVNRKDYETFWMKGAKLNIIKELNMIIYGYLSNTDRRG